MICWGVALTHAIIDGCYEFISGWIIISDGGLGGLGGGEVGRAGVIVDWV